MIPVFAAKPHIAARMQDLIAAHMMASLPHARQDAVCKAVRIPPPFQDGNAAQIAKRAAERRAMLPDILRMKRQGMLNKDIARELKISVDRLRVTLKDAESSSPATRPDLEAAA